jgi:superfamily II DNA helicase RecQ
VQQAGRAGRDGNEAVIYICSAEAEDGWTSRAYLVQSTFPPIEHICAVWTFLDGQSGPRHIAAAARGCEMKNDETSACVHWLARKQLIVSERDPADRRRLLYRVSGDFERAKWDDFRAERADAVAALDELRAMWRLPGDDIPAAITAAFER